MPASDYRERVSQGYVHAGPQVLAPETVRGFEPRRPYLEKLIRDHFPSDRNASILDLGCGHGAIVYFARQAGYRDISGVDRLPEQVAAAKSLGIDGVGEGDLMETLHSLPDKSQDAVVTFDVIEHFTKAELLIFVDGVRRVLKPGGRWIINAPNAEGPSGARIRYGDYTHEQAFTRASLSQLLLASDFDRVDCFEDQPIPHGVRSAVRWLLWKLFRTYLRIYLAVETGDTGKDAVFSQNLLAVAVK